MDGGGVWFLLFVPAFKGPWRRRSPANEPNSCDATSEGPFNCPYTISLGGCCPTVLLVLQLHTNIHSAFSSSTNRRLKLIALGFFFINARIFPDAIRYLLTSGQSRVLLCSPWLVCSCEDITYAIGMKYVDEATTSSHPPWTSIRIEPAQVDAQRWESRFSWVGRLTSPGGKKRAPYNLWTLCKHK